MSVISTTLSDRLGAPPDLLILAPENEIRQSGEAGVLIVDFRPRRIYATSRLISSLGQISNQKSAWVNRIANSWITGKPEVEGGKWPGRRSSFSMMRIAGYL
jgi:hypothetical protein